MHRGTEFDLRLDFLNAEAYGMTINLKEARRCQLENMRSEVISGKAQVQFKTITIEGQITILKMCLPPTGRKEFVKICPKIEEGFFFFKENILRLLLVKYYVRK